MDELVCLECGKEMDYGWAPCPHCGWKAPEPWETADEMENIAAEPKIILSKPTPWVQVTAWGLLAVTLSGLVLWLFR